MTPVSVVIVFILLLYFVIDVLRQVFGKEKVTWREIYTTLLGIAVAVFVLDQLLYR